MEQLGVNLFIRIIKKKKKTNPIQFNSFDCKICLSPKERLNYESVEWFFGALSSKHSNPIEYTENILLSPEDKTLSLYNLKESHTGQYICKLGKSLTAPYFLTVINSSTPITEVNSSEKQHESK